MKNIFKKIYTIVMIASLMVPISLVANERVEHQYVDFSSDRSTYFFRVDGGENNKVFFDFFSPFDPTIKVKGYDVLTMYELEDEYYFDSNGNLMINIEDLKKLYAPYFDYEIEGDVLNIQHSVYEKLLTDGFGERSTTIEYTRKVWELNINVGDSDTNVGEYDYTQYVPVVGGRNKGEVIAIEIDEQKSITNEKFILNDSKVEIKSGEYYIPIEAIMTLMGKTSIEEEGYLAIQQENLGDVTIEVDRDEPVENVVVPRASNVWKAGSVELVDENYTWANYMNDIADGKRTNGWMWRAFYIPSGKVFKDGNGEEIFLDANRIVPFSLYIPTTYQEDKTRLVYMLHGGTGNENTPSHRIMDRNSEFVTDNNVNVDEYAEMYDYIILSPNGWTQNPQWRENQALYSFEKSYEMVMNEFPVDEDKVFITGNSLGGKGTLELAMRFSDRFQAMAVSAPKITDRDKQLGKNVINIENTKYDLEDISDMPTMVIQGTADSTTSFKTQIGTSEAKGAIASAVMPKLNNAIYVAVEEGSHSYAYGSVLEAIFDFFESTINETQKLQNIESVSVERDSRKAIVDGKKYKLATKTRIQDECTMITLGDLERIYGDLFKVYQVNSYDSDPSKSTNYYTIIYNNKSLNFNLDETKYRNNIERYKEDANIISSGAPSDENQLVEAPRFMIAPYEDKGNIFVPLEDFVKVLELDLTILEKNNDSSILIYGVIGILISSIILRKRRDKNIKGTPSN